MYTGFIKAPQVLILGAQHAQEAGEVAAQRSFPRPASGIELRPWQFIFMAEPWIVAGPSIVSNAVRGNFGPEGP